jgi:hypothetical protein
MLKELILISIVTCELVGTRVTESRWQHVYLQRVVRLAAQSQWFDQGCSRCFANSLVKPLEHVKALLMSVQRIVNALSLGYGKTQLSE